jgi:hypothetical protein
MAPRLHRGVDSALDQARLPAFISRMNTTNKTKARQLVPGLSLFRVALEAHVTVIGHLGQGSHLGPMGPRPVVPVRPQGPPVPCWQTCPRTLLSFSRRFKRTDFLLKRHDLIPPGPRSGAHLTTPKSREPPGSPYRAERRPGYPGYPELDSRLRTFPYASQDIFLGRPYDTSFLFLLVSPMGFEPMTP